MSRDYELDVQPDGCSLFFAPSEQIRALQLGCEGDDKLQDPARVINGPAADYWALGILAFFVLTGENAFQHDNSKPLPKAPKYVREVFKLQWRKYKAMLILHRQWVSIHNPDSHLSSELVRCHAYLINMETCACDTCCKLFKISDS